MDGVRARSDVSLPSPPTARAPPPIAASPVRAAAARTRAHPRPRSVHACARHPRSPVYELGKKRKGAIDALKALTPDAVDPNEIDIPMLEQCLKEAATVGADQLKMKDDAGFGARMVKRAMARLKAAKAAQRGEAIGPITESDAVPEEDFSPEVKQIREEL